MAENDDSNKRANDVPRNATVQDINRLLAEKNFKSDEVQEDLAVLLARERINRVKGSMLPLWMFLTGFSAYNLSRFTALTGPGKAAAGFGFLAGLVTSFKSL